MGIRKHPNPEVDALLKGVDGTLVWECLYSIPFEVAHEGYEVLRRTTIWASEETGRPIPSSAQALLRWLRDHFGSDADRRAALARRYTPEAPDDRAPEREGLPGGQDPAQEGPGPRQAPEPGDGLFPGA